VLEHGYGLEHKVLDRPLDRAQGQAFLEQAVGRLLVEIRKRIEEPPP
jgi:hypothetical protein